VAAGRDVLGDFGQAQVHRLAVANGQDKPDAFALFRANRAEEVGRGGALVARRPGARAAPGPAPRDLVLLADARFVGEPDFYLVRRDAALARDLLQAGGEFYGMARPSFRRRGLAGGSGGGMGMDISVLGVDLGKNLCSVVGLDASGAVVMRRKMRRETLIALAEKLPACIVGMEACCGAHHLGRAFAAHGHDVRLMSPEYVRPYVKAQKNDDRDAEGIAEAARRPTMRFVELKSQDQLDMQTLHRSSDRLVGERTAVINQLRAIVLERGMVAPQGKRKLEQFLIVLMDEQGGAGSSARMILLVADARTQWAELDRRIGAFDAQFVRWAKENEEARRLTTIPGVGAIVASALVAAVGQAESFGRGRDLAAWLGLVPQQFTTGGKPKLLGISKRANKYLRRQLIHGARAALPYVAERDTPLGRWAKGLMSRAHRTVAVVAFANKLARIAWAVLRRGERFAAGGMSMAA
jgi:transposase